jgi:hypothetical protein
MSDKKNEPLGGYAPSERCPACHSHDIYSITTHGELDYVDTILTEWCGTCGYERTVGKYPWIERSL